MERFFAIIQLAVYFGVGCVLVPAGVVALRFEWNAQDKRMFKVLAAVGATFGLVRIVLDAKGLI